MQRQRAGGFPDIFAHAHQFRLFLVEFVLNLADEFLQHVFQRHDADRAAVFIHDDGEVQFPFEKQLQQFFQPRRFPARKSACAPPAANPPPSAPCRAAAIKVLDVNHAARLVQVAAFAKRKARVARFFRQRQAFGQRRVGVEGGDFVARPHDFARDAMAQIERVQNEVAPARRALRPTASTRRNSSSEWRAAQFRPREMPSRRNSQRAERFSSQMNG